jgi:uncharacterized membrane protein YozB (DUF420 family)
MNSPFANQTYSQKPNKRRSDKLMIAGLIILSLVPTLGGIVRLSSIGNQTAENARFLASPIPIVIHVVASLVFCLIGAFQFSKNLRQRNPTWHKKAGRWLMVAGLASAFSGIWMTVFYTIPQPLQGMMLYIVRLLVGFAMIFSIVLAWQTIVQRNIAGHQAWMMRAYALGQGAGTQALIFIPYMSIFGQPNQITRDILMTAAWMINLIWVEWLLHRKTSALNV